MRIIGGIYKGKKLLTLPGFSVRPTLEKVREAIFDILIHEIEYVDVLDLFAGTGSLGIEAMSRGARSAVFIDRNKEVVTNIYYNLNQLGLKDNVRVLKWDIEKNLYCLRNIGFKFGLVFLDPPYGRGNFKKILLNLVDSKVLKSEACVVVEHKNMESIKDKLPEGWVLRCRRGYGRTMISFLISKI